MMHDQRNIKSIFVNLFWTTVFEFPKEEERRRIRQGNYIAEDALKISDYWYRWNRVYVTSYIRYDAGQFNIMYKVCQKFREKDRHTYNISKNSYFQP
jgi:hypothetical protein